MTDLLRRACALVVMILLLALGNLAAQQPDSLSPGMRVRVKVPRIPAAQGRVVSVEAASFRFQPEDARDTIVVDYARIERLDVSRGLQHRVLHDAGFGAIAGLVIGGIVGAEQHDKVRTFPDLGVGGCSPVDADCIHNGGNPPREPTAVDAKHTAKGAVIGAAAGFLVGVGVGNIFKSEVWEKLRFDRDVARVTLLPLDLGGVHVTVHLGI
jgi:hypothetical protein